MRAGDVFPGSYLKAADLGGKRVLVTIESVTREEVGDEKKAVAHFEGKEKGLVLNVTNWHMIEEITGAEDSEEWTGTQLVLYPTKTDFAGKRVDCIRIDKPKNSAPVRRAPEPEPGRDEDADSEIGF